VHACLPIVELSRSEFSLLKGRVGGCTSKDEPIDLLQKLQKIQCAISLLGLSSMIIDDHVVRTTLNE